MRFVRYLLICLLINGVWASVFAQIPAGYYYEAVGKGGRDLQVALSQIIDNHCVLSYNDLWKYFAQTDVREDSIVWDIYSDNPSGETLTRFIILQDQCTSGGSSGEGQCYSREHTFCQSWLKPSSQTGSTTPGSDLFHIYPVDGYVNTRRNNNPYGEVSSPTWVSRNGSRLGTNSFSGAPAHTAFEPIDAYKGDIARSFFYMATRYMFEDEVFATDQDMVYRSQLRPWAVQMLLKWHALDPVSDKERARNTAVYKLQGNRNPFIDFPELVAKIWASDSINPFMGDTASRPDMPRIASLEVADPKTLKMGFTMKMIRASVEDKSNYVHSLGDVIQSLHYENDTLVVRLSSPMEEGIAYHLNAKRLQGENYYFIADTTIVFSFGSATERTVMAAWTFDDLQHRINDRVFPADIDQRGAVLYADGSFGSSVFSVPDQLTAYSGTVVGDPRGNSALSGAALAVLNSTANGQAIVLKCSTKGCSQLKLTCAVWKTAAGFSDHQWSWSADGSDYTPFEATTVPRQFNQFELKSIDLSQMPMLEDLDSLYLRLRFDGAVAEDGNNRLDNIVLYAVSSVGVEEFENSCAVYPNPARHELFVRYSGIANCTLLDMAGRQVLAWRHDTDLDKVNLSGVAQGFYILRIEDVASHRVLSRKVVVRY